MHRRPLVRTLAALLAVGAMAAGCSQDNGAAFVPVGDQMRSLPGMERVDDFYSPPQLKVAEVYEVTAHPSWHATPEDVCTVPTEFVEALDRAQVEERVARLSIRYGDDGETYPYDWSMDFHPGRVGLGKVEEQCRTLFALRDLPAGATTAIRLDRSRADVQVHMPSTLTTELPEARTMVSELVGIPVDDLAAWDETGFEIWVSIDRVSD